MTGALDSIVQFFKTRKTEAMVGPKIEVNYDRYEPNDDVGLALKKQWEVLRKELDSQPSLITSQEWRSYRPKMRQEKMTVEIDGVVMELEGPVSYTHLTLPTTPYV